MFSLTGWLACFTFAARASQFAWESVGSPDYAAALTRAICLAVAVRDLIVFSFCILCIEPVLRRLQGCRVGLEMHPCTV